MSKVHVYVLMGVCGCGKTEIAHELAKHVEAYVLEGDLLHPKSNIDKMSKGIAVNEAKFCCFCKLFSFVIEPTLSDVRDKLLKI